LRTFAPSSINGTVDASDLQRAIDLAAAIIPAFSGNSPENNLNPLPNELAAMLRKCDAKIERVIILLKDIFNG